MNTTVLIETIRFRAAQVRHDALNAYLDALIVQTILGACADSRASQRKARRLDRLADALQLIATVIEVTRNDYIEGEIVQ